MVRRPTDDALHKRLDELLTDGAPAGAADELRAMLDRKSSVLVSRAAKAAAALEARELAPDLTATFERLLDATPKADEGCLAKVALAEAMDALGALDPAPFLRGVRHVQMEAAYPSSVDTAPPLRATCAFALARLGGADAMLAITGLVADPEREARVGAVKAIAHRGGFDAELLLRLKALSGDPEVDVTAECLAGLMGVEPARSLAFVADFLRSPDEAIAEAAALALGESRELAALPVLWNHRAHSILSPGMEDAVLLAVALSRRDEGVAYLLDAVANDTPTNAARAVTALRIYAHDAQVSRRVRAAVESRDAAAAWRAFREYFE